MSELRIQTLYPTWRVYPRVQYFRNRFLSLYPRFIDIFGSVEWKIQDQLEAIKKRFTRFKSDLEIKVITKSDSPTERFSVDPTSLPTSTEESDGKENTKTLLYLCFLEGQDPHFIQNLKDALEVLNKESPSEESMLFFAVNLFKTSSDQERTIIQNDFDEQLKWRPLSWNKSWSVVFKIDSTDLPAAISDYFEQQLVDGFSEVAECLKLLIPSETWDNKETIHPSHFENFVSTNRAINSIAAGISAMEKLTPGIEGKIGRETLLNLARIIKCRVIFPFYEKLSVSSHISQGILVDTQFDDEFTYHIASSTEGLLLKIMEEDIKKLKYKDKVCKYSELVNSIITDVWPLVQKLENEYAKKSTICMKMSFEVNSYLEQSSFGKKINWLRKAPVVPAPARKEILGIKGVHCIGTVYNQFTVYLESVVNNEQVQKAGSEIKEIMKRHSVEFPWSVKKVTKPPIPLTNIQYENGDVIRSVDTGTVGAFVFDDNDRKYALTCAHLLGYPAREQDVFIKNSDGNFMLFARSNPDLTVCSAETSFRLIDFTALKIIDDVERLCETNIKDEDGLNRPWEIWDGQGANILHINVYKHGGESGLTFGIISSADMELPPPALPVAAQPFNSYVVVIDNLPGSDERFTAQGDSGSVVCIPRLLGNADLINNPSATRVIAVSMVHLGGFQTGGMELDQTFSFGLNYALQLLYNKSNVELRPP